MYDEKGLMEYVCLRRINSDSLIEIMGSGGTFEHVEIAMCMGGSHI